MTKITNSYVFLLKKESKERKVKNGDKILDLTINIQNILKNVFDASFDNAEKRNKDDSKIFESYSKEKTGYFFIKTNGIEKKIDFILTSADSTEYLDIIIEDITFKKALISMEKVHNEIVNKDNNFNKDFIVITTYDSISEYYCNLAYPKLNSFERQFRKLLFLIYTAQFKKLYFETTIPEKIKINANKIIRKNNIEEKLKNYMYSIDFGTMREILFEKNWTTYDEKKLSTYLKKNKDLTKLSDSELREKILSIKPTNDWNRLFNNKGLDENFEKVIKDIGDLRNIVAHNKLFNKDQYNTLRELLRKNTADIKKAIRITETDDFKRINKEKAEESAESLNEALKECSRRISQLAKNLIPKFSVSEILKDIIPKGYVSTIIKEILNEDNK